MNTKKILAFMLSLAIICPIGSTPMAELIPTITANAEDLTPTDESYFTFDATTGTITGYNTDGGTDVVIPSTIGGVAVTSIGDYAFVWCESLTSITIPSSVTSIGERAFYNCTALTSVNIPDSVTSIGERAFDYCTALKKINVDSNNENYSSEDGILFNKNKTKLICYPAGKEDSSYTIPSSVTTIGNEAFSYCESLTSITILDSVTSIGEWAFSYCTSLTNVTIPSSVTSIGDYAFYNCTALESVTIPDAVTSIGKEAFSNCTELTSVTIPESVTSIGKEAFYRCTSLTSVTFNDNSQLTSIGERAFYYCTSLESITIPNSVTSIGEMAFYYCTALSTVTFEKNSQLTSIGKEAFLSCTSLKSLTIPDSVTTIGNYAFFDCTALESITIPDSVTSIGNCAFYKCTALESITIPDSVTSIGENAFNSCTSLTSITIPNSVTSIGDAAFYNCTSLTSVTIPDSVTSIGKYAFYCCTSLESITIPNSVTYIGVGVFSYCTSLTSVTIPESVDSIYDGAFANCTSLTSVTISNSVTSIGYQAFFYCTSLESITFNENSKLTSINDGAFYSCESLTSITIPDSVTSIGERAFVSCTSLTSITIPESVTSIGMCAFQECTKLESVAIPNSVTTIGISAFQECTSLTSITIPESVTTIGMGAFYDCTKLESIFVDKLQSECEGFSILTDGNNATVYYAVALTNNLENITSDNLATKISPTNTSNYTATLTADEGYTLPKDVTITVGGNTLTDGYTFENGVLTILAENLTDDITIKATATLNEYSVTSDLTNITSNGAKVINHGEEYTATLTAKDGYTLPKSITVKVGDTTLTNGYTFVDGVLTIDSKKVTGDITIEATATLNEYKVTSNLTNITSNNEAKVINHGEEYTATLTAKDGYTLPKSITVKVGDTTLTNGYTFVDGVLTIDSKKVTGDITITATATLNEYSVTSNLTNITSNGKTVANHGIEYKATLTAKDGYTLPESITVKVGNTTLTGGYTFKDGVLTIKAENITDDITIEATAEKVGETTEPIQFTSADLLKLKKHILGISKIDDISSLDVTQDNQLNILDFLTIKNIILNQ